MGRIGLPSGRTCCTGNANAKKQSLRLGQSLKHYTMWSSQGISHLIVDTSTNLSFDIAFITFITDPQSWHRGGCFVSMFNINSQNQCVTIPKIQNFFRYRIWYFLRYQIFSIPNPKYQKKERTRIQNFLTQKPRSFAIKTSHSAQNCYSWSKPLMNKVYFCPLLTLWCGRSAGSLDTEGDDRNRLQAVGRGSFRRWSFPMAE